ncbi:SRPBCC domain-containing protein [uncultured Ferrovibrio sp.]|jgi:carbon monoxide dehydrogenase subunit G|uniref:CoxG family protein n=1 Tax=uncultured Ferrovibrio sp. TaxID=1576913 RepID=UPI00261C8448|nr:SRPBCC domain-containing protein [uncultured Ferrovibrio sp.]
MEIRESFIVPAPVETVWSFFEDVERVSKCVPGLESVEILDKDQYKVVIAQKIGFFSATFEVTTKREEFETHKYMKFSSVGRTVRGAIGNLRSNDLVEFETTDDGATRVQLMSQPALGGMLGAVGHKMIVSKSRELTEQFAAALCATLGGAAEKAQEDAQA